MRDRLGRAIKATLQFVGKHIEAIIGFVAGIVAVLIPLVWPLVIQPPPQEVSAVLTLGGPETVHSMTEGSFILLTSPSPSQTPTMPQMETAGIITIYSVKFTGLKGNYCEVVWSEYNSQTGRLESNPNTVGLRDMYSPISPIDSTSDLKWLRLPSAPGTYNIIAKVDCRKNIETSDPPEATDIREIDNIAVATFTPVQPSPVATFTPTPMPTPTSTPTNAPGQTSTPLPTGVLVTSTPTPVSRPTLGPIDPLYPNWPKIPIPTAVPIGTGG
jgi:hypothetical protein